MKRGGNAVDAAVATGFALAVTYPFAGNIGGGGFMVIHMADGRSAAMDYREVAPLAATRDMYLDANGKLTNKSLYGALAVGVPGSVAGMAAALAKYGTMSLHDVMQPAIRLASEGFTVDSALYRSINASRRLIGAFAGAKVFLPDGQPPAPGSVLKQPDLARTLTLIADQGPAAFYTGPIADKLVAEQKTDGGIITKEDLARYKPIERVPIEGTYRGYTLFTMPPSSSGGVTVTETMNILETVPTLPAFGTAEYFHLLGSADAVNVGERVAWCGSIVDASLRAYALLVSSSTGTFTNAGSPSFVLRSMNARRNASATRWVYSALPNAGSLGQVSSWLSVSSIVMPPDDDGGIVNSE